MELEIIFKAMFSLGAVFAIMYILLRLIQKYSKIGTKSSISSKQKSIKIDNVLYIDEGNKIVNVSNKAGRNYLILIGKGNSFLLDKYEINQEIKGDINETSS